MSINLNNVYTCQSYIDSLIVNEKLNQTSFKIKVAKYNDGESSVLMLIDGHHSFMAAKQKNIEVEIEIVDPQYKSLSDYVESFGDLNNPVNIMTGKELW